MAKHSYIDCAKLHDFSDKTVNLDSILDDLIENYKLTNILIEEDDLYIPALHICDSLLLDYKYKRANYKAYIEKGMDARVLMELRKSAVLNFDKSCSNFYSEHSLYGTVQDIKNYRTNYIKKFNSDYQDLNWQYYYLVRYNLGSRAKDFYFDFENCFEDGDYRKQTHPEDYIEAFRKERLKILDLLHL